MKLLYFLAPLPLFVVRLIYYLFFFGYPRPLFFIVSRLLFFFFFFCSATSFIASCLLALLCDFFFSASQLLFAPRFLCLGTFLYFSFLNNCFAARLLSFIPRRGDVFFLVAGMEGRTVAQQTGERGKSYCVVLIANKTKSIKVNELYTISA